MGLSATGQLQASGHVFFVFIHRAIHFLCLPLHYK